MKLRDLLEKVEIAEVCADLDTVVTGVCFDTRKLRAGELFVANKGYQWDGHLFIEEAVLKGAACVICENAPQVKTQFVLVRNTREALAAISAAWFRYPASGLKMIGVTGTNGKTTVTSLIKRVIEECTGRPVGLIGTNGNMIGDKVFETEYTTPESYGIHEFLDMAAGEGCRYIVMEVSSHALQLGRVYGIDFEVGVFTNLTPDHLDFHDSMEEYAGAKAVLFSHSRNAVINIDDGYAPLMIENSTGNVFTYAIEDSTADLVAKNIKLSADKVEFCVLTIGNLIRVELPVPGVFSVYNALAVTSAVMLLGFEIGQVASALQSCGGVKGRVEVVPTGCDHTVLIDYAHTPDALSNIISAARGFTRHRVVTLFGCGGDRDRKKRPLMGEIAARLSDFVIVTSDNPRTEEPGAIINEILAGMESTETPKIVIENRREAIYWALENAQPGDVLILAGKGHETYQIFGKEKRHFDEREVVAEYYAEKKTETERE